MMFKQIGSDKTFEIGKLDKILEEHFLFIRRRIHPVIDAVNTGYNFALRSNPIDEASGKTIESLDVAGGEEVLKAYLTGCELFGYGNLEFPNPTYNPIPLVREIVLRMKKDGVVFFEQSHESGKICEYIAKNIERNPTLFTDPFRGAIVVLDDLYRPEKDLTVRLFPEL